MSTKRKPDSSKPSKLAPSEHFDVLIVGAGMSGIGAAYQLQKQRPGDRFVVLEVGRVPCEAFAECVPLNPELPPDLFFADLPLPALDELQNRDGPAHRDGTQHHTECGTALALAIAGVDDKQAASFTLGLVVGFVGRWRFDLHQLVFQKVIFWAGLPIGRRVERLKSGDQTLAPAPAA